MRTREIQMRRRSRPGRECGTWNLEFGMAVTSSEFCHEFQIPNSQFLIAQYSLTPPRKRRVLSVVRAAHLVPVETERVHVALRGMREREPIRRGMAGVIEMQRFGRRRIDPHRTLGRHVDEARRANRPCGAAASELDRGRFNAQKLSDQTR